MDFAAVARPHRAGDHPRPGQSAERPPTVLVVGPLPPPIHGAARVTALVAGNLRERGVHVLEADTGAPDGGPRLRYHLTRFVRHLRAAALVWHCRHRAQSLYIAGAGGLGLWYQVLVVLVGRLSGVQIVFHHHSFLYVTHARTVMRLITRTGGARMVHVALCDGMGQSLRTQYPAISRVRICSNAGLLAPPDPDEAERPRPSGEALVLGHLGNLGEDKGLSALLDTLRLLRAEGVPARLLVAGSAGTAESANRLAVAAVEFGAALEQLGPVRPTEVDTFYRRIDAFVLPSRNEAEPLVVLEAARNGVPAIAFRVGCLAALVPEPDQLVGLSADFPAAALPIVRRLADADTRRSIRREVLAHFAARQSAAVDAHGQLVALLTEPAGKRPHSRRAIAWH